MSDVHASIGILLMVKPCNDGLKQGKEGERETVIGFQQVKLPRGNRFLLVWVENAMMKIGMSRASPVVFLCLYRENDGFVIECIHMQEKFCFQKSTHGGCKTHGASDGSKAVM